MKRLAYALTGIALALTALWGGAYLMHQFTISDWQTFPLVVTAFTVFYGGVTLALWEPSK